jgi:hypothetical protein
MVWIPKGEQKPFLQNKPLPKPAPNLSLPIQSQAQQLDPNIFPEKPETRADTRLRCPCPGCPDSLASSKGWKQLRGLLNHLMSHYWNGQSIPQTWLDQNNFILCPHPNCSNPIRFVSKSHGMHSKCKRLPAAPAIIQSSSPKLEIPPPSSPSSSPAPCTLDLPDIMEIYQARVPVYKHIPKSIRSLFLRVFNHTVNLLLHFNDLPSWKIFAMMVKCTLATPITSGKGTKKSNQRGRLDFVSSRMIRWLSGDYVNLWSSVPRFDDSVSSKQSLEMKIRSVKSLCEEGKFSQACKLVGSGGLAPDNDATLAEMKLKHPIGPKH